MQYRITALTLFLVALASAQLTSFGDGTFLVGIDISSGTYRSSPLESHCYWARLSGLGGTLDDVIANDVISTGPTIVEITSSDYAFRSSGCAEWKRVGRADSTVRYQEPVRSSPTGSASTQSRDRQKSSASASDVEPLTEKERKLREAMMRVGGESVAGDWVRGLGFKRRPESWRDYLGSVAGGFLAVSISTHMARSWERLSCDKRRAALEALFRAWKRKSASMWRDGITRTQVTGVGVAKFESSRMRKPELLGVLQASENTHTVTDLTNCE